MSTCIAAEEGVLINVADLRLARIRNVSDNDNQIELHFKGVRDSTHLHFYEDKVARDKVFEQIREKMLG